MKLTSKGRYAVTAVLDVALHTQSGPIPLMDISERQEISLSYLEQLFSRLRRHGIVNSVRGPGGGYVLGRAIDEITISDIIVAIDEPVDATRCKGMADCQNGVQCLTHSLWVDLSDRIYSFLNDITLSDLVSKKDVKSVAERQDLTSKCGSSQSRTHAHNEIDIQIKQ
ncbi:Fe-S cluster assembly transcriptional regulator IscR [Alteromonadaceae bacterium M269]|nr:Fe-S cluster assembly transcriptional regulator IscR [Alteromonadaceae bacterium M269]